MELIGQIKGLSRDMLSGQAEIALSLEVDKLAALEEFIGKRLRIDIKPYRKKRSLEANAYYWVLITQLAEKLNVSVARMHNLMLRDCGYCEVIDGHFVYVDIPDTDEAEETALEAETFHIMPADVPPSDGYRSYKLLRSSSSFDTKEMSRLINLTVEACQEQGIDTITPEEMERMMALYERKHPTN